MKRKRNWKKTSIGFLSIIILVIIFCYWQNTSIVLTKITYSNVKVPIPFEGFKILQISDLHNQRFGKNQSKLLEYTKAVQADIIVITGDLIDSKNTNIDIAMEYIINAIKIAPIYFVTGNHEYWSGAYIELKDRLLEAGVEILDDSSATLEKEGKHITLLGLGESQAMSSDYSRLNTSSKLGTSSKLKSDLTILLSHRPEKFDIYCDHNIDLVLSGHAHGGQFRLPFVGGFYAPSQGFLPKYTSGLYEKNGTSMIVSRGLGNSIIPIRLFNRPEVVCVTLSR